MHITADDITVTIDGREVLTSASASVQAGQLLALVGPSGSGKTTLLNTMALLRRPDSGRLHIDGVDATRWRDGARVRFWRNRAAFVFQDYGLIDDQSVAYNVGLSRLGVLGIRRSARPGIERSLRAVGLQGRGRELVAHLSGGEKQRAGLARAMFRDAAVIFADEPTASLDRSNRELVAELLRAEAQRGAAVLVATHDETMMAASDARVTLSSRADA